MEDLPGCSLYWTFVKAGYSYICIVIGNGEYYFLTIVADLNSSKA
jgi:hypothetical protein